MIQMPVTFGDSRITKDFLRDYYRNKKGVPWNLDYESYISDPSNKFRINLIHNKIKEINPANILDAGSGPMHLRRGASDLNIDYYACDISTPDNVPAGAFFAVADIEELPFRENFFQCVVCSETIEHLVSPKAALMELKRVLAYEGKLILTVPNWFSLDSFDSITGLISFAASIASKSKKYGELKSGVNTHLTKLPPWDWKKMIECCGLSIVEDGPIYVFPYIPYFMKTAKELEKNIMSNMNIAELFSAVEKNNSLKKLMKYFGQFHYFVCEK